MNGNWWGGKSDSEQNHPDVQEIKGGMGRMQLWKETQKIGKPRIVNTRRGWLAA